MGRNTTILLTALTFLVGMITAEEQAFSYPLEGNGGKECFIEYITSGQEGYAKVTSDSTLLVLTVINAKNDKLATLVSRHSFYY